MSFTNLITNSLNSSSNDLIQNAKIDYNGIQLKSSDITVTISSEGLTTTNVSGLNIKCPLNLNNNNITNVNDISCNDISCDTLYYNHLVPPIFGITGPTGQSGAIVPLSTILSVGNSAGPTGINMNGNDIIEVGKQKFSAGINISDKLTKSQITSDNIGNLNIESTDNLLLNLNNVSKVELTPNDLTLTGNGQNGIILNSTENIKITTLTGIAEIRGGTTYILSQIDKITISAETGIDLIAVEDIILNTTIGNIKLESAGDINLNAPTGGVISMNSGDNCQFTCGENFFVQTNSTTGIGYFLTGNIQDGGGMKWNNWNMSISFTSIIDKNFDYNTPNAWEMVFPHQITIPDSFIGTTFAISFNMNIYSNGSSYSDKELAFYWEITDSNSNTYTGQTFNNKTPWAQWFNPSQYASAGPFIQPMPICYTDYYNMTSPVPVNPLTLNLYMYADNFQSQKFKATIVINSINII